MASPNNIHIQPGYSCCLLAVLRLRLRLVMPPRLEIRELYRLASEQSVEIRHLDYKKDSLQDIFLKAMES